MSNEDLEDPDAPRYLVFLEPAAGSEFAKLIEQLARAGLCLSVHVFRPGEKVRPSEVAKALEPPAPRPLPEPDIRRMTITTLGGL